ncbi:hypothetical protein SSYRP_v1c09790 [Spiroplasma syrphidicola EA-1]|uniref:Transmembrane protein n=1 Tax=Spiroplasma syrphidicola EA-1 TaxID=1276229 RepID=R4UMU3_9MOLU|nr:hypothetical protein [Spiroplasma syrphidicola]AGM26566.1 hypothetical protein SSYRP_v1c09790 [Spiroplasma syrphidicola EA-1]
MFNNLTKKMKVIWLSSLAGVMTLFFVLGLGFSIPGMGLESLKFIKSVEKQIDQKIPKNKFVLDGQSSIYTDIMEKGILNTYIGDAVSTINFYEENSNRQTLIDEYSAYAKEWFNKTWGEKIANKQDVDLNTISHDLIEFDKSVAEKYHNYGYVHSGLEWLFKPGGIKSIFAQGTYDDALRQQTIIDQAAYKTATDATQKIPEGITVIKSAGTYIVNNKVWFFNLQNEVIEKLITAPKKILKNPNLKASDRPADITTNDLYHPNFTLGISLAKTGFVFLLVITPIVFGAAIPMIVLITIKRK